MHVHRITSVYSCDSMNVISTVEKKIEFIGYTGYNMCSTFTLLHNIKLCTFLTHFFLVKISYFIFE